MRPEKYPLFSKGKDGALIRNYYCSDCHCGPFLHGDIRKSLVVEIGGDRQRFYYCRKCYTIKFSPKDFITLSEESKKREEYILSGKALEDITGNKLGYENAQSTERIKNSDLIPVDVGNTMEEVVKDLIVETKKEPSEREAVRASEDKPIKKPSVEKQPDDPFNIAALSGKQIVDFVKKETGQLITITLKSKKRIILCANKYLAAANIPPIVVIKEKAPELVVEAAKKDAPEPVSNGLVNLEALSGRQIIALVLEKTGIALTISPKSKKSLIKQASKLLTDKGSV